MHARARDMKRARAKASTATPSLSSLPGRDRCSGLQRLGLGCLGHSESVTPSGSTCTLSAAQLRREAPFTAEALWASLLAEWSSTDRDRSAERWRMVCTRAACFPPQPCGPFVNSSPWRRSSGSTLARRKCPAVGQHCRKHFGSSGSTVARRHAQQCCARWLPGLWVQSKNYFNIKIK